MPDCPAAPALKTGRAREADLCEWNRPQIVVHELRCLLVHDDAGILGVWALQQHHHIDRLQSKLDSQASIAC